MLRLNVQLHKLARTLKRGEMQVPDLGNILPASVMLHDIEELQPIKCCYMNNWGCERLGTSVEEVNELGEEYYVKYFVKEESFSIFRGMAAYLSQQDFNQQYNFFQRVRLHQEDDYTWFYSVCKLVKVKAENELQHKVILLSSPITGMNDVISRVTKTLDQDNYIRTHYRKFSELTAREKQIISLIAYGKSTREIAEILFISVHTVSTHRKNIIRKTECNTFIALIKFAEVFDLV